jgi:hypothetical protein
MRGYLKTSIFILLVFCLLGCAEQGQPIKQPLQPQAKTAAAFGPNIVWDVSNGNSLDEIRNCYDVEGSSQLKDSCAKAIMLKNGASEQAMAFSEQTKFELYANSFQEFGKVDLVRAANPFMANSNDRFLLVNGDPNLIDSGYAMGIDADKHLKKVADYPKYNARYPSLGIRHSPFFSAYEPLPSDGQRFVFIDSLIDGCRACIVGETKMAFDFDSNGRFLGVTFLDMSEIAPK